MAVPRLDVALGAREMTVELPGADGRLSIEWALPAAPDDPGPALLRAFVELEAALPGGETAEEEPRAERLRVRVALLPPLADARLVRLPPLRAEEVDAVLRRDAARHFIGSARPLVVAGERLGRGGGEGPGLVLAVAAPRALMDALQRAVEARGWELDRIVPAHPAWLHALEEVKPAPSSSGAPEGAPPAARLLVAVEGETAHVIRVVGDVPDRIRRVPASDAAAVAEAAGPGGGRALLLAEGDARVALAGALQAAGWALARPTQPRSAAAEAARHAGSATLELVPPPLAWARRERSRRVTVRMVAAAVVMLALAAAVHLAGTSRAFRSVQRERAELREAVAPALAARDSLDRMTTRLETLRGLGRESSRWTFSLVEMSMLLPSETHLIALRAVADTAVIEAEGGRAGDALAALRSASSLHDVRLEGAIQREIEGGTTTRERFTLSAVLAPRAGASRGAHVPRDVPEEGR
jgi:hypothetical protein